MAKNQVSIKINAQDNASTPIQKLTAKINETTAAVKKAQDPLKKLQNSFLNFSLAVPGVKLIGSAMSGLQKNINECVTAFAALEKSTKQLQFAQNVNVQLKAVGADLTRFAADMSKNFRNVFSQGEIQQAISELAFDHTYDQIEQITKVAGDLASATGMTLSQAVDTLSNTLNGKLSPELKRIAPELGALNAESLKGGDAITVLGDKLKGLANEMSGSTGASITAFNNTVGDLKETLGGVFSDSMTPMRNYFTELLANINTAISEYVNLKNAKKAVDEGTATSEQATLSRNKNAGILASGKATGNGPSWWTDEIAEAFSAAEQYGVSRIFDVWDVGQDKIDKAYTNFLNNLHGVGDLAEVLEDEIADYNKAVESIKTAMEREAQEREEANRQAREIMIANAAVQSKGFAFGSFGFDGVGQVDTTGLSLKGMPSVSLPGLTGKTYGGTENSYGVFGGNFNGDALKETFGPIIDTIKEFSVLKQVMSPVNTILSSMYNTLKPFLESLLGPITNALGLIGKTLAQILIPLLDALSPVIKLANDAFIWLYNNVIRPVGNGIISLFNMVYNAVAGVCNGFIYMYNLLVTKKHEKSFVKYKSLDSGWMSAVESDYGSTGTSSNGGGASYTAARDITVNVYYNHSYVNGDAREIAVNLRDEIILAEALGY